MRNSQREIGVRGPGEGGLLSLKEVKDIDPAYSETLRTPTLEAGPSSITSHMDKVQSVKKA